MFIYSVSYTSGVMHSNFSSSICTVLMLLFQQCHIRHTGQGYCHTQWEKVLFYFVCQSDSKNQLTDFRKTASEIHGLCQGVIVYSGLFSVCQTDQQNENG